MSKQLLLLASFFSFPCFSQTITWQKHAGIYDQRAAKLREYEVENGTFSHVRLKSGTAQMAVGKPAQPGTTVSWDLLCGSSNIEGMLSSASQPLQFSPTLNAVSFIHQTSDTYTTTATLSPAAKSGLIVAELSTNWGQSWDSTAVWASNNDWGRFPQGAIYNPSQNTNLANAQIVTSGLTTGINGLTGNFYASKSLNTFNTSVSTTPGALQYYSFGLSSYPNGQAAHNWSRSSFVSTDDGVVRSVGIVQTNYQDLKTIQGFAVATGTFNGTGFDWKVDVLNPPCTINSSGEKMLMPDARMAFNQAGTVGYLVGIGVWSYSTYSNKGFQPVVYKMDKTTNANATWTLMPAMNFNSPGFKSLARSTYQGQKGLAAVYILNNDTMGVPFFDDYDVTVDKDNKLHIAATLMSTASDHMDSLNYAAQFTTSINPTEKYRWRHTPGSRPYLYDFLGNGNSPWTVFTIDSISSESPGTLPGEPGYYDNHWDSAGASGAKPPIQSRIQLGRTPFADYIIYAWTESDSNITNNVYKWNNMPNIKVRSLNINTPGGFGNPAYSLNLGFEQNVSMGDPDVFTRSTLYYMSPLSGSVTMSYSTASYVADFRMPFTVTNSNPYSQHTNNSTWYGDAKLSFSFSMLNACTGPIDYTPPTVGKVEDEIDLRLTVHPNPAQNELFISAESLSEEKVTIQLSNGLGQNVGNSEHMMVAGTNSLQVDISELPQGIYFMTIEKRGIRTTKKFLKE